MKAVSLLLPPLWSYTAGLLLRPLLDALSVTRPEVVTSAVQVTTLCLLGTAVLAIEARRAGVASNVNPDLTRRDWQQIRATYQEQERQAYAAQTYARTVARQFKLVIHNQHYTFPPGITPAHLLHLARVVGAGYKPTDRALVPPFERGAGKSYQIMKDYMIYNPNHAPGELAVELSGRGDWSLTRVGMGVLLQWVSYNHPLFKTGQATKTACLRLAKQIRAIEQSNIDDENDEL